jgi:TatD DNase family protein
MIDSHCHIAGEAFAADLPEVVARARAAGVAAALVILAAEDEAELARWPGVQTLWPEVHAAVGVHPHQAQLFAADPLEAGRLLSRRLDTVPGVRAVGEIGLDYHYEFSPRELQQAVFRAQLDVARERDRLAGHQHPRIIPTAGSRRHGTNWNPAAQRSVFQS